jgi:hypothetical protein
MSISVSRIENDLADARVTLNNINNYEDIKVRAANRGITAERIEEIFALHTESNRTLDNYKAERAIQIGLTDRFNKKEAEAYSFYMECVETARITFEDQTEIMGLLGLVGKRLKALAKWTIEAVRFYRETLKRENILQALSTYNVTKEDLEKGIALVAELLALKGEQAEQKGKVQVAYKARNVAYKAFRKPMRQLRKLLRIEYRDNPQQLERVGILVYSDGYVKAETRRKNEEKKMQEEAENEAEEMEPAAVEVEAVGNAESVGHANVSNV